MNKSVVAPEWFSAKAIEVKGEGYPRLADVPTAIEPQSASVWSVDRQTLVTQAAEVESQSAASGARPTPDEIRASAAQLRASIPE